MKFQTSLAFSFLLFGSVLSQEEECVFDLVTQTDDFLKDSPFYGQHVWNEESKTAIIQLSKDETLIITRGGCLHFSYYFDLIIEGDESPITDHYYWIRKIFTLTEQVPDFDNETMWNSVLDLSNPHALTKEQHAWYFNDERYCSSELFIEKTGNTTSVRLGYYYC